MKCVVGRCDLASVYEQMLIFVKLQFSLAGFNNSLGHTGIQQTWSRWSGSCCIHKDWLNYLTVGMAMAHGRKWLLLLPSWARLMDRSVCMNMIKEHENKSKTGRTVHWEQGEDKQISRSNGADTTMNKKTGSAADGFSAAPVAPNSGIWFLSCKNNTTKTLF